ncbi:hypothetical protein [Salinithrix halophila]|uniref:Uncharacterized protein n=1 Tax=Salinithrix halophila TaxID=1485204 RepID=A0ABV8JNZ2_9BACL
MKKILAFILVFVSFFFFTNKSNATEPIMEYTEINNKINLTNPKTDYYKVFNNGNIVYKGSERVWNEELRSERENYKVGIYKKGKLSEVVSIKTGSPQSNDFIAVEKDQDKNERNMERYINSNMLKLVATSKSVVLEWDYLPDRDGYFEIYRNGGYIGKTKKINS